MNKLETFTNESYNDIFSHEIMNGSKEQLSEGEVKLRYNFIIEPK